MSDKVCEVCGGKMPSRNKRFCSTACYGVWKRDNRRGKDNANWKGGKVRIACVTCGKEFEVFPSNAKKYKRRFCSWECRLVGMRGKGAPSWKGGLVTRECEACGAEFSVLPSIIEKGHGRFCSRKCAAVAQKNSNTWVCEVCGETFEAPVSQGKRRYCSMECRNKTYAGSGNPNWRDRTETRICKTCGCEFEFYVVPGGESRNRGLYCSQKCAGLGKRGELNSLWRGGKVETVCKCCGKEFKAYPRQERKFCSAKCVGAWFSTHRVGSGNPGWIDGRSFEPYPPEFNNDLKDKIRERDHYTCAICRLSGNSVHHIDYDKSNNDSLNLITLCKSCHGVTNYNRPYWQAELSKLQAIRQVPLPLGLMRSYTELSL